jgi:hypothetical protein
MTTNKQAILTALIETYGSSVTRKNLIEFEQAGRGNVLFVGALYRSGRGKYQLPAVYVETPAERYVRRAKKREYLRAWRAKKTPEQRGILLVKQREYNRTRKANESPEKRNIRLAKDREYRAQRTPKQRHREYRAWKANESPERRNIRLVKQREYNAHRAQTRTPEERGKLADYNREYHRVRYANVEERRERDSRSLKPYPKSYRDTVLANYAAKGLRVSQRMMDELDGKRDPQTPPLFRRA